MTYDNMSYPDLLRESVRICREWRDRLFADRAGPFRTIAKLLEHGPFVLDVLERMADDCPIPAVAKHVGDRWVKQSYKASNTDEAWMVGLLLVIACLDKWAPEWELDEFATGEWN